MCLSEARGAVYEPGEHIGDLRVKAELGSGGMGVVLRVELPGGEARALKVLTHPSRTARQRLRREAEVQQRLVHPHIVRVYEVLELPPGALGVLMELVEGPTLKQWLSEQPRALEQVEPLFRQLVDAVAFAHARGWVHRDIKPSNVLLAGPPEALEVRLTDFGLVRAAQEEGEGLTLSGAALGTPGYMAPEQARSARQADARADVFSLGCTLHRMVTGMDAFSGDWMRCQQNAQEGAYIRPDELLPELPRRVAAAIRGALLPDPEARIPDCTTLLRVLDGEEDWPAGWRTQALAAHPAVVTWSDSTLSHPSTPSTQDDPSPPDETPAAIRHEPTAPPRRVVAPQYKGLYPDGAPPPPPPKPPPPKARPRVWLLLLPLVAAGLLLLVPALRPAPVESPASPQAAASVDLELEGGPADVCFSSPTAGCLDPGALPPGTYTVWLSTDGVGHNAGVFRLASGQRLRIRCDVGTLRCAAR